MAHSERVERLVPAGIAEVRDTLLRLERIRRWFPVAFEVEPAAPARLAEGDAVPARAEVLDQRVAFTLEVPEAGNRRIRVRLDGFVRVRVDAALRPGRAGTRLVADVGIEGSDLLSGLAAAAVVAAAHGGGLDRIADAIAAEAARGGRRRRRRTRT